MQEALEYIKLNRNYAAYPLSWYGNDLDKFIYLSADANDFVTVTQTPISGVKFDACMSSHKEFSGHPRCTMEPGLKLTADNCIENWQTAPAPNFGYIPNIDIQEITSIPFYKYIPKGKQDAFVDCVCEFLQSCDIAVSSSAVDPRWKTRRESFESPQHNETHDKYHPKVVVTPVMARKKR